MSGLPSSFQAATTLVPEPNNAFSFVQSPAFSRDTGSDAAPPVAGDIVLQFYIFHDPAYTTDPGEDARFAQQAWAADITRINTAVQRFYDLRSEFPTANLKLAIDVFRGRGRILPIGPNPEALQQLLCEYQDVGPGRIALQGLSLPEFDPTNGVIVSEGELSAFDPLSADAVAFNLTSRHVRPGPGGVARWPLFVAIFGYGRSVNRYQTQSLLTSSGVLLAYDDASTPFQEVFPLLFLGGYPIFSAPWYSFGIGPFLDTIFDGLQRLRVMALADGATTSVFGGSGSISPTQGFVGGDKWLGLAAAYVSAGVDYVRALNP